MRSRDAPKLCAVPCTAHIAQQRAQLIPHSRSRQFDNRRVRPIVLLRDTSQAAVLSRCLHKARAHSKLFVDVLSNLQGFLLIRRCLRKHHALRFIAIHCDRPCLLTPLNSKLNYTSWGNEAVVTQEQVIEVGSLRWFYREAVPNNPNNKPPVVLLHGLPAQSYSWRHVLPALAEQGFRAIAPDWIGFGYSAKPDRRTFAYTPDAYVKGLSDLLDALDLQRCTLVVQGFIGSTGLQFAVRNPEQIERLAILNTPLTLAAKLPWKMRQLGLPLVGEMVTQDPLLVDRTLEGGGGYRVEDADLDVYRRPFLKSSDAGRALFAAVQNLQLDKALTEINNGFANWEAPTLVAWGIRDPWLPVAIAESFVKMVKGAELVKLEEVGHYPQEDWHEKVCDALMPFLRRQLV